MFTKEGNLGKIQSEKAGEEKEMVRAGLLGP